MMSNLREIKIIFCLGLMALLLGGLFLSTAEAVIAEDGSAMDLGQVVVTASKVEQAYKNATQNISIITRKEIESIGVLEVTEVLDLLPSVDVLEYGSAGSVRSIHTRGAYSSQVLTLVDGRPINTPRDGVTDFNQIPVSSIERIEVLRGPASNIYGASAVGGVINVITKKGKKKMETSVLNKSGSFNTSLYAMTHGAKIKNFDYFLTYDHMYSDGHRPNADYVSKTGNIKLGYQLNDANHIGFSTGYNNSVRGSPGLITNQDLDDKQENVNKYFDLTCNGELIEGQDIFVKVFETSDRVEFVESFNPLDKDTNQTYVYGVDSQISQTFFDVLRTAIGFNYLQNKLNSSISSKHSYNVKGGYFESEVDLWDQSTFKFGARLDDYSNFGDNLSPSASLNFWLWDKVKVHTLVAKSFRAPTFNDLYWPTEDWGMWGGVEGNPTLEPEKAISYEAGMSGYFFGRVKTDITYFQTDIDDSIEWTVDENSWWRPENINEANIKGGELETEFVLRDWLKANFNYTYLSAKDKETKKWLVYRPQHLYKLRLVYSPFEKWDMALNAIYKTKRYANAANTDALNPYFVMNVNSTYQVTDSIELLFEAKNVFDREYQEQKDYSTSGRSYYGGMKISF